MPAFGVYLLQRAWVARRVYVTVTGKAGPATTIKSLAPWARWPLLAGCLGVSTLILYFYALLLYASLVRAFGADETLTLAHYANVFTAGRKAIHDTLIIAAIGMPLGALYGVVLG